MHVTCQRALWFLRMSAVALLLCCHFADAATFTVVTNADGGPGSLRQAIMDANASPDTDTITFAIPAAGPTIVAQTPLPKITNTLVVDGFTQSGVRLVGPGNSAGFEIDASAVIIRGVAIQRFADGVRVSGGRTNTVEGCTIISNSWSGVALAGGSHHQIVGNVISGNNIGIVDDFGSRGTNYIRGNFIGTDASGTNALGNSGEGIYGSSFSRLIIGGPAPGDGNVISGNRRAGVFLNSPGQAGGVIQGNFIGTDRSGAINLGNAGSGIYLIGPSNRVGGTEAGAGNITAFNGGYGVSADSATLIQGNRIFSNSLAGITSPNTNCPILSHAGVSPGFTLIVGSIIGTPMTTYRIEFFANDACDSSGFGEGQRYLGFTTATPDETRRGPFAFTVYEVLPIPSVVTATATGPQSGTSIFSPCQPVTSPQSVDLSVRQTDSADPASILSNITYTVIISNAGPSRATNVVLEDLYPYQAGLVDVQVSQGTWTSDLTHVLCSFGNLNAGTSAWAKVVVNANAWDYPFPRPRPVYPEGGYYTNKARVSSDNVDHAPGNNASEEVTAVGFCDVGISLTLGPQPYRAGVAFPATLHVTNAGPDAAQNIGVSLRGWQVSITPDGVSVTNLLRGTSQDIPLSVIPLNSGAFYIQARTYWSFQPDPNSTNDSFFVNSYAEPGPGVLSFERDAYAIKEDGAAVVRVLRTGGTEGVLPVSYATSNGTAMAYSDYIPAAGTLVFAPGQEEAQIVIPAVRDQTPECNEFFSMYLFSADGSTVVGSRSNVLISIAERPPKLAGYVRPITVSPANPRVLLGQSSTPVGSSADGQKVLFMMPRPEIPPPLISSPEVFLHDRQTHTSLQLTSNSVPDLYYGYGSTRLSGDGRVAAFARSYWSNTFHSDVVVQEIASGSNWLVTAGLDSGQCYPFMVSSNGATVVFGDYWQELYAFHMPTRTRYLLSAMPDGTIQLGSYPTVQAISDDGRFILFTTYASLTTNDLGPGADLFVYDMATQTVKLVTVNTNGFANGGANAGDMSSDGRWVTFSAYGTGLSPDAPTWGTYVYLRDMVSGVTRVLTTYQGLFSSSPGMSRDGRFIAFEGSTNYESTEIYLYDTQTGTNTLVAQGCSGRGRAFSPRVSGDGRFVCFQTTDIDFGDGEFLPNDLNIFRWDRSTKESTLISVNKTRSGGVSGYKTFEAMSFDGNVIVFTSDSPDLVFGDTNNSYDVFVWEAGTLPHLDISISNGVVTISWPSDSPAAVLETRTPESNWESATGSIQQQFGKYLYQAPVGPETVRFFQLRLL